ncbi:phosphoenolpyruvate carboxylase [Flavobacterium caeni]|uniref:Phosphoenolpyruvate carboxylase n=1 Tax=Flavobacterium caeni TaxID=490189 RepID=A0A1G5CW80_9FLAO|nr:phosphoenolpyruvate carboxylase [Flavobacterium caeni]SCY06646.1 Phosphoenolpyruvate carboxylase, type 1 [Flavobacterium caeni]
MYTLPKIERFNRHVLSKYQIYNSVFLTLPFDTIGSTGSLLPLFSEVCERGLQQEQNPQQIIDTFAQKYLEHATERERIDMLFRFIQYVERQIVLFDAIEDAAFDAINNLEGHGSLRDIKETADASHNKAKLKELLADYKIRTVLTAHPTQFYPGSVLGIITDLTRAIKTDDLQQIKELLSQLGKTPFIKSEKPTPFDEAVSLTWYLENVFYQTAGEMLEYIRKNIFDGDPVPNRILNFGFWPGGDRDGNPFVTTAISLQVAERLRSTLFKCYYRDIRNLKRRLTFSHITPILTDIELKVYRSAYESNGSSVTVAELNDKLEQIKQLLIDKHQSLYLDLVEDLLHKLRLFGLYFATLDIRQNSKIHDQVFQRLALDHPASFPADYLSMAETDRIAAASHLNARFDANDFTDETVRSTLESVSVMKTIQQHNGEEGANRYIISNCESALNIVEALALFTLGGWPEPSVDIVPLFEIIDDLKKAHDIMEQVYTNPGYAAHLKKRGNRQTIMLGFSDGTKDGGYLMANWSIYKAKENLTAVSRKYGIEVIFFDGRGGPPARGGGKTHKFYASLGPEIENRELQLTIQGQTISSNFGTRDSCRYNLENLLSAGLNNHLYDKQSSVLSGAQKQTLDALAEVGYNRYLELKQHPRFIPYLEKMSTLQYYAKTNIGSRPSKRSTSEKLDLADLRAIPFVGSWSQIKQNVPGFYGVGSALRMFEESGRWQEVQDLYHHSLFFRTLLENSMMSLAKCFFPLTAYMKDDPEFGDFWKILFDEFTQAKRLLLKIAGHETLMENYPDGKASIDAREHIVVPLLVIQQYALQKINQINASAEPDDDLRNIYQKMVTRSLFGNTNASRNSA